MSEALRTAAPRDDAKAFLVQPMPPVPFGTYIVIGKLGHGGMAEVNLAVVGGKGGFRKLFVIKRLHSHLEHESGFIDMFLDEARLAASSIIRIAYRRSKLVRTTASTSSRWSTSMARA